MPSKTLAVIGTDTNVGKSEATRSLRDHFAARDMRAVAIKPFASGESERLPDRLGSTEPRKAGPGKGSPAGYRLPLSPYGAIRRGEPEHDIDDVRAYIAYCVANNDAVVIEGIGGVLVPLSKEMSWLDLHSEYGWPCVLIARSSLGTINHTLLTFEALTARDLAVTGFVLSGSTPVTVEDAGENAAIIAEMTGMRCLGIVPHAPDDIQQSWDRHADWSLIEMSTDRMEEVSRAPRMAQERPSKEPDHAAR